jgi:glycine cleavage system transcriptional repressor
MIEEITQTTLLGQFAGHFLVQAPEDLDNQILITHLKEKIQDEGFSASVTRIIGHGAQKPGEHLDPYVLTITGPDSPGLIPGLTGTIASFDVNIDNFRSITISAPDEKAGELPAPRVLVLELSVPSHLKKNVFRQALLLTAEEHGVEISLQHRDIFEAIHRL